MLIIENDFFYKLLKKWFYIFSVLLNSGYTIIINFLTNKENNQNAINYNRKKIYLVVAEKMKQISTVFVTILISLNSYLKNSKWKRHLQNHKIHEK